MERLYHQKQRSPQGGRFLFGGSLDFEIAAKLTVDIGWGDRFLSSTKILF